MQFSTNGALWNMLWCIILLLIMFFKKAMLEEGLHLYLGKISWAVYIKMNHHYFNLKFKYEDL